MAVKVRILASKRLTKSFSKIKGCDTWESIPFEQQEAIEIVSGAIRRLNTDSDPLTITISPIEPLTKKI